MSQSEKARRRLQRERQALPIAESRTALVETIASQRVTVVVGETGSGKTTQLPQFLLDEFPDAFIACTQPRRVAAVTVAKRVATERYVALGTEVGYSVRFDEKATSKTRIKYLTDGMLLREMMADSSHTLKKYSIVIIDEAHERTVNTEILCGVLKNILRKRSDGFKVIIMSATIDTELFSRFFDNAPIFSVPGRQFPVTMMYCEDPQPDYLDAAFITTLQIHKENDIDSGDILVFLTGQEEIEALERMLVESRQGANLLVRPVFAAMPHEQQLNAFVRAPAGQRKVIIATNIAETSLTISGVRFVVDTGVVKARFFDPRKASSSLSIIDVSGAQAAQRAGRAGREAPGLCFRLYTETHYLEAIAPSKSIPEILRCDLAAALLQLCALRLDPRTFDFLERPSNAALKMAAADLLKLGAVDTSMQLTADGRDMARLPVDPRVAKCLLHASRTGCLEEVIVIAAMMSVDGILYSASSKALDRVRVSQRRFTSVYGDHLTLLNAWRDWHSSKDRVLWCRDNAISARSMTVADKARLQMRHICSSMNLPLSSCGPDEHVLPRRALVAGFFSNIADRQSNSGTGSTKGSSSRVYRTHASNAEVSIHPSSVLLASTTAANTTSGPLPPTVLYGDINVTTRSYMVLCSAVSREWLAEIVPLYKR